MFSRIISLVGEENFKKLQDSRVLVVGLGGVGGYIAESLVRSGIGTVGFCDFDVVEKSNLNRQILATVDTLGMKKTDAAEQRAKSLNPDVKVIKYDFRLTDPAALELENWDFVADAIDDVPAKIALISAARGKIISCMGTGNKMNPFEFEIRPIGKTEGDPLARSIRKQLRELGITDTPVLYSKELPVTVCRECVPTISYMPAVAGLEISSYIIKKILA